VKFDLETEHKDTYKFYMKYCYKSDSYKTCRRGESLRLCPTNLN
jgi:hypothetical protein